MNEIMNERARYSSLYVLKGIMIFAIVIFHSWGNFRINNVLLNGLYEFGGDLGNCFFYLLSGFGITQGYYEKVNEGQISVQLFLKKRLEKIYPVYFISSLFSLYFIVQDHGMSYLNAHEVLLNLFMITTGWVEDIYPYNMPCWFLSALLLQYIIWFVITSMKKIQTPVYVYSIMVFLGMSLIKHPIGPFLYSHNGQAMTPFFVGCLLNIGMKKIKEEKLILLDIALGIFILLFSLQTSKIGYLAASGDCFSIWTFVVSPFLVISAIVITPFRKILEERYITKVFGNISTYVFFWHCPFFYLFSMSVGKYLDNNTPIIFIVLMISLILFAKINIFMENIFYNCLMMLKQRYF